MNGISISLCGKTRLDALLTSSTGLCTNGFTSAHQRKRASFSSLAGASVSPPFLGLAQR